MVLNAGGLAKLLLLHANINDFNEGTKIGCATYHSLRMRDGYLVRYSRALTLGNNMLLPTVRTFTWCSRTLPTMDNLRSKTLGSGLCLWPALDMTGFCISVDLLLHPALMQERATLPKVVKDMLEPVTSIRNAIKRKCQSQKFAFCHEISEMSNCASLLADYQLCLPITQGQRLWQPKTWQNRVQSTKINTTKLQLQGSLITLRLCRQGNVWTAANVPENC
eukprot:5932684-Amphidinium_carterae.1